METSNEKYQNDVNLFWRFYENIKLLLGLQADNKIAESLGIRPQAFANQKKRGTIPLHEIVSLCERQGLSLDMVFGLKPLSRETLEDEHLFIPLLNVKVEAGVNGLINDSPEPIDRLPFKRSWLMHKGYREEKRTLERLCLIKARGESMEPTISDGEVLLVDTDESMCVPEGVKNGAVYILRWGRAGDELSVKRVHLDWAERQIIAVSDNELYRPKAIDLDEDRPLPHYILGRVIWVGKENI